jgi:hypothetical protein
MKHRSSGKFFVLAYLPALLFLIACMSCNRPHPVPQNKEAFIGLWLSHSGFKMEINASGTADLAQIDNPMDPESSKLDVGVTPEYSKDMLVKFGGDTLLIIVKPRVRGREYRIDRNPYMDGDTCKMILNGVLLIKQK